MNLAGPLQAVVEEFSKFPGVGAKSARRLALFLLRQPHEQIDSLVESLIGLKTKIKFCKICFNIGESDICDICSSDRRDKSIICVVEDINDVIGIERSHEYNGTYHVLGGVLSPLNGVGPESLKVKELLQRLNGEVKEVILALNPDTEGEATSLYLNRLIKPLDVSVSRIARGLPIGGNIEFADDATIGRAVTGRGLF
ncbi:MAG: recombination protein RecR [Ignavibacteriales bacterium]|jgi:recombination protein RecR|nr:recombination protein RecR [Ignavibacteriales bacterium]MBP7542668.1 recombination protein RecR [Ignavibacteriaceae bacterium]MBK7267181.1 recombination protein RecR [Ignavibacteriales bacterium]MBK8663429.1 recombination protein RecR [Ignavibacteriales bacterium]MBP9122585.1 recombination protein RecR [Ignavibacteriaceae bacterium]